MPVSRVNAAAISLKGCWKFAATATRRGSAEQTGDGIETVTSRVKRVNRVNKRRDFRTRRLISGNLLLSREPEYQVNRYADNDIWQI
jgi:hypothetical protein